MATHEFTLDIRAPVEQVFAAWWRVDQFPQFMPHVLQVRRVGPRRTAWVVEIAGQRLAWESEGRVVEPNRRLAWQSVAGLENDGEVSLEPTPEGTRARVTFHYNPPYGVVGDAAEVLWVGGAFQEAVQQDLSRLKTRLEAGAAETKEGGGAVAVAAGVNTMNLLEMAEFSPDSVVEKSIASTDSVELELYCFEPGQMLDMYSDEADEVVVVLQGSVTLLTDGMEQNLMMANAALVPADTMHGYRNNASERTILCHVSAPCF